MQNGARHADGDHSATSESINYGRQKTRISELILGNKQLLSVLFIVIVLLGVFFAMGFLAEEDGGVVMTQGSNQEKPPLSVEAATPRDSAEPSLPSDRGSGRAEEAQKAPADEPVAAARPQPVKQEPVATPPPPTRDACPRGPPPPNRNRRAKRRPRRRRRLNRLPRSAQFGANGRHLSPIGSHPARRRRIHARLQIGGQRPSRICRAFAQIPGPFCVLIGPLNSNEAVAGDAPSWLTSASKEPLHRQVLMEPLIQSNKALSAPGCAPAGVSVQSRHALPRRSGTQERPPPQESAHCL